MRNIIVCAEHGFVMQLVVNLVAFYESNREKDFHIYIARTGLDEEDDSLLSLNCPFPAGMVSYWDPEEISIPAFEKLLPEHEEHALYLDVLTLVYGNVGDLYDSLDWPSRIAAWHECGRTQEAQGKIIRYEYGEPWLDTLHTEDALLWWGYAKKTPFYVPLMELYVLDTCRSRQMTRAIYTEYLDHDRLHTEYAKYKQFFDRMTGKKT